MLGIECAPVTEGAAGNAGQAVTRRNRRPYTPRARCCQNCGASFKPKKNKAARYCSHTCRQAAYRRRQARKRAPARASAPELDLQYCLHCLQGYWRAAQRTQQLYCSAACRQAAQKARKAAAPAALSTIIPGIDHDTLWMLCERAGMPLITGFLQAYGLVWDAAAREYISIENPIAAPELQQLALQRVFQEIQHAEQGS